MDMIMYSATEGTGALARLLLAVWGVRWMLLALAVIWGVATAIGRGFTLRKCGLHPWAAAIPFYSDYEMGLVGGLPNGLAMATTLSGFAICVAALLGLVPLVLLAMAVYFALTCVVACGVSRAFARPLAYALGLIALGPIFWMMLGVTDWAYKGTQSAVEVMRTGGEAESYEAEAPSLPDLGIDLSRAEAVPAAADVASMFSPSGAAASDAAADAADGAPVERASASVPAGMNFGSGVPAADATATSEDASDDTADADAGDEGASDLSHMNFAVPARPNEFAAAEAADAALDEDVDAVSASEDEVPRGSVEDLDESEYDYELVDEDPFDDDEPPLDEDEEK